jgi:2-polyprenyl-3-methyl-5-hydroxy-6-metoxy-1,4-benzoquinol methylase
MYWKLKGAVQSILGHVLCGQQLHYWLQRRAGGLQNFNQECDIKVQDYFLMANHLRDAGLSIAGTRFLEMGSGWYPTFPFALYLAGAKAVHTLDLNRYMKPDLTLACAQRLASHVPAIAHAVGLGSEQVAARQKHLVAALERNEPLEQATQSVVRYAAPADASDSKLPHASVDVVFSNSVLEHVPGPVIEACFREARRILRPGGVIFHSVNCGDHYAYVDKKINQLHYLKYSHQQWKRWDNSFLYQNRLRAVEFIRMAEQSGFAIELNTAQAKPQRLAQLSALEVHADFSHYTPEQLAITSVDFIGRNPS